MYHICGMGVKGFMSPKSGMCFLRGELAGDAWTAPYSRVAALSLCKKRSRR